MAYIYRQQTGNEIQISLGSVPTCVCVFFWGGGLRIIGARRSGRVRGALLYCCVAYVCCRDYVLICRVDGPCSQRSYCLRRRLLCFTCRLALVGRPRKFFYRVPNPVLALPRPLCGRMDCKKIECMSKVRRVVWK